jgi:uncharacterized LabA/DUF88 family protein
MPKKKSRGSKTKRTSVYIDGYNLYYGRLRDSPHKWLDIVALFDQIIKVQDPRSSVDAVKLFTAYALAKFATHGQLSVVAQQSYHRALQLKYPERMHITLGNHSHDKAGTLLPEYVAGQPYDRLKRARVWKIEEKQTDVNIAISMYRDASKGLFDHQVIVTNDSDAEPTLKAIREDFHHVTLGVITPIRPLGTGGSRSISASLEKHAHWMRRYILDSELAAAQLPPHIPTNKKPIRKPDHW